LNINRFFEMVLSQNEVELQKYFHETACIRWPCTNEVFSVQEYIRANCEYPGAWDGEIERIEEIGNTIIVVARVFPVDRSSSSHVVSFIKIKDDLIIEMDEYWSDDGLAPEWRKSMNIGKPIS